LDPMSREYEPALAADWRLTRDPLAR